MGEGALVMADSWEERMAERAAERAVVREAEGALQPDEPTEPVCDYCGESLDEGEATSIMVQGQGIWHTRCDPGLLAEHEGLWLDRQGRVVPNPLDERQEGDGADG